MKSVWKISIYISLMLGISSCGEFDDSHTRVSFTSAKLQGLMAPDGGAFIYGRSLNAPIAFSTYLSSFSEVKEYSELLPSGTWSFRAMVFQTGDPNDANPGHTFCGEQTFTLKGGKKEIPLVVTRDGCKSKIFASREDALSTFSGVSGRLKTLLVNFCTTADFVANNTCSANMSGRSMQVIYPETPVIDLELSRERIQKYIGLPASAFLRSGCLSLSGATANFNVRTPTPIQNSKEIYGMIVTFDNSSCSGAPERVFPLVFDYPVLFNLYLKTATSSQIEVNVDVQEVIY